MSASGDDGPARIPVAGLGVGDLVVPGDGARSRIEGHEPCVPGCDEHLVIVEGQASHRAGLPRRAGRLVGSVLPDEISGRGVQGLCAAPGNRDVHRAVGHERCRLALAIVQSPRPGELKLVNVTRVDLIERAEPPSIQRAAPVRPVGRIGAGEHGVGDWREASGRLSVNQRIQRVSAARGHRHGRRRESRERRKPPTSASGAVGRVRPVGVFGVAHRVVLESLTA